MSKQKFVQQTLTMPSQMPFFSHNINFPGLRKVIEGLNIQTNSNQSRIQALQKKVPTKLPQEQFIKYRKTLDQSLSLGPNCEKYVEQNENITVKISGKDPKKMEPTESYCRKIQKISQIVEMLIIKTNQNTQKIQNDDKKHQNKISQAFRRLQDKIQLSLQSFNKVINSYFGQTNKKITQNQSTLNTFKLTTQFRLAQIQDQINQRVSQNGLNNIIKASQQQIKKQLVTLLDNDHMKRMATLGQYSTKLKQTQKDVQLQQKYAKQKLQQLSSKIAKLVTAANFEIEKHKIYQKFSQYRNKIQQLFKKNQQFIDFRKDSMMNNQKNKQSIIAVEDQIKKLNSKQSSFKKMENIGNVLQSLDPHLICQIGNQVKLHQKQIGKLQKQLMLLDYELKNVKMNSTNIPQVNHGQNADFLTKMIKEYMSNMDFEGRVKKAEKDIHQLMKKSQIVHDLEKKIYLLTKEMDMGLIMRELKKKCDQENTHKDIKIVDGKIEKLFEFYKQSRKQLEDLSRKCSKNVKDPFQAVSMTTKKLYPPNCLSCTPSSAEKGRRRFSKPRFDSSIDESIDAIRNSNYLKPKK